MDKLANGKVPLSPGDGDFTDKVIELNINVPKFNDTKSDDEVIYFHDMWGGGPLIPIVLQAKIKKINGDGAIDKKGLGRAQFIWEWQDNEKEDLATHLDKWITKASGITKYFINKVFEDNRDKDKFPFHGFNCPAKFGGKRGIKRPAPEEANAFVFPQTPKDFPNQIVHELKKRDWTAVSYADPTADLKDRKDIEASTAVLFHPSIIAGDRFRVSVCLASESLTEFDKDLESDAYYDLIDEAKKKKVPCATTYYFEIWRHIKATYYYTPSFKSKRKEIVYIYRRSTWSGIRL